MDPTTSALHARIRELELEMQMRVTAQVDQAIEVLTDRDKQIAELVKEREELIDLVMELFAQGCYDMNSKTYNHWCLSAYESAQEWLLKHGLITEEQCVRA